jgi:superfamily I DNA/RNA helicase
MTEPSPTQRALELDREFRQDSQRLDSPTPWFGAFTVQTPDGQRRLVKLSKSSRDAVATSDTGIIPWGHPYHQVFIEAEIDEECGEFEYAPFKPLAGTVAEKAAISPSSHRVIQGMRLEWPAHEGEYAYELRRVDDAFEVAESPWLPAGLSDVRGRLTKQQFRYLTSGASDPVLIQGGAGSGKTTVGLARASWLASPHRRDGVAPIVPERTLIVMFNKSLKQFIEASLPDLELEGATPMTFHEWALRQVKRAYKGTILIHAGKPANSEEKRQDQIAESLKKRAGMLRAVKAFVAAQEGKMLEHLRVTLAPYDAANLVDRYATLTSPGTSQPMPPAQRLSTLRAEASAARTASRDQREVQRQTQIHRVLDNAYSRFTKYKEELPRLLRDRELLRTHLAPVSDEELDALDAAVTRVSRREAPPSGGPGPYVAYDDLALLLSLIFTKHGGFPGGLASRSAAVAPADDTPERFDHVLIDEVQDFGAVELSLLLDAAKNRRCLTVVGDINQQIQPGLDFMGWEALRKELGIDGAKVAELTMSHRCTPAILAVADAIRGGEPAKAPAGRGHGTKPQLLEFSDKAEAHVAIADQLIDLTARHPNGHIVVVTAHVKDARDLAATLRPLLAERGLPLYHPAGRPVTASLTQATATAASTRAPGAQTLGSPTDAISPAAPGAEAQRTPAAADSPAAAPSSGPGADAGATADGRSAAQGTANHAGSDSTQLPYLRHVHAAEAGHEFVFAPGISVTSRLQIKGLEFDAVIMADANAEQYLDTPEDRRRLYTVLTRARKELVLITTGTISPLLAPALAANLLDHRPQISYPEFTADSAEPF